MPADDTDPQTAAKHSAGRQADAGQAGDEIDRTADTGEAPLTTDSEAQQDDSVIQPDTA